MLHTFTLIFGPFFPGLRFVHQLEPRWKGCCESLSTTLTVELAPPVFHALSKYPYVVFFFSAIPFSVILWKYPICPQNADENAIASYNKECERYRNRLRWGALGFAIGVLLLFTTTVEIHKEEIKREKNNLEEKYAVLEREAKELKSKPREVFLQAANCNSPSFAYLENDTGYAVKVYTKHALVESFSPRIYEIQPHQSQVVASNLFSSLLGQGMWVGVVGSPTPATFLNHGEITKVSKLLKT
jgi:hypothetical protein